MLYAINTVLLYKNGPLLYTITCFLGAICYKKQGVAAICFNHFGAFAICYILLNGLCYMLVHTPWGGPMRHHWHNHNEAALCVVRPIWDAEKGGSCLPEAEL